MEEKKITLRFRLSDNAGDLEPADKALLEKARLTALNAYAPYSRFRVGAAIRLDNGEIITGNNQENAAYPSGLCAERVALFAASAQFPEAVIEAIAVSIDTDNHEIIQPVSPCGACRQVLAEYEHRQEREIRVIFSGETGKTVTVDGMNNLLPMTFTANNLKKSK
ncbi:MAG: cytidine deaminase [Lentimicrobium sp.]|uniref:cytidine deaminase n=1 Tax=Lentimicrobium sp. TaxID=2034841 RepID=UPI0025DEEFD7|nr:cytidine deaminase [Lentimicrobium sp.]MCO5256942.1 cytidine deaminase [Lentimicrobium sp.]MCO5261906.1 cytidine deaminase [Lentimicrobium sp.]HOP13762.1 cytidine deaminase [Lentimicrobium sp.]HPF64265.1 cytidine deaminase [Lentimicrobium sp.]HRW69007.1 cytidine deaminase [Lentimicrobium sp.]